MVTALKNLSKKILQIVSSFVSAAPAGFLQSSRRAARSTRDASGESARRADFVALAQKVDDTIQALMDSFNDPSVVATPQDGGTALYGLLKTQLNTRVPAVGSVAASKLKTD